jgi:hypothetical protein
LLRKSGGLTNATISVLFSNQNGSITVDSGTLRLANANYVQGSGALTIKIGGRGAGQFGQLSVSGNATLSGPLNISLASGFTPMNGDQFQILSCASRSGTFSALNVPAGFAVNYSGSGVTLVVTNAALIMAQHASARLAADSLGFSLQSVSNRTYTVERSDDLRSANWAIFTNFTGDGSLMRINVPVTNVPQRFFRVRER